MFKVKSFSRPPYIPQSPQQIKDSHYEVQQIISDITKKGIDFRSYDQKTQLMFACERAKPNNIELVRLLLQNGANPNEVSYDKKTALHYAAISGNYECIQLLFNAGANLNPIDKFGKTPLHYAAIGNRGNVIIKILSLGGNPNLTDNSHHTPLAVALHAELQFSKSFSSVINPLFEKTDLQRILENCVAHPLDANQRRTLAVLASRGVPMFAIGEQKRTPIMTAAQAGDYELLDILLSLPQEKRAHVNEANRPSLWTALHLAARYGHSACVARLLVAGASTKAATEHGWTPLQKAAEHGHLQTCIELVRGGADIFEPNGCERDLIASNFALRHYHHDTFKFLFQLMDNESQHKFVINLIKSRYDYEKIFTLLDWKIVSVNLSYQGETILNAAISCLPAPDSPKPQPTWTLSLIEKLLKYSPNINSVSPSNSPPHSPRNANSPKIVPPMVLAYERNDNELEELLLKYGATPYIQPGYQIFQGLNFDLSDILNVIE